MREMPDYQRFCDSLQDAAPPAVLCDELKALWWARKNDWDRAHQIVQDLESRTVLLACTELPLVAQPVKGKELVDVTDLLAERMAHLALSARGRRGPPATGRAG